MSYKLICVNPFHGYQKGQEVIDPAEVAAMLEDREHHFVRVHMNEYDHMKLRDMQQDAAIEAEAALARAAVPRKGK